MPFPFFAEVGLGAGVWEGAIAALPVASVFDVTTGFCETALVGCSTTSGVIEGPVESVTRDGDKGSGNTAQIRVDYDDQIRG